MDLRFPRLRPAPTLLAVALLTAALLTAAATVHQAWQLHRIRHWNARFTAAYTLAQQGDLQAALDGYRALETSGDPHLRRDARFNSGNLYLLESRAPAAGADPGAGLTLVELAKQSYREVLREDDQDWDARYNLEQALRLAPDVDRGADALPPPPDSRHAPSSARGVALGLP